MADRRALTIYLDAETYDYLQKLAKQRGDSMSGVLRGLLRDLLHASEQPRGTVPDKLREVQLPYGETREGLRPADADGGQGLMASLAAGIVATQSGQEPPSLGELLDRSRERLKRVLQGADAGLYRALMAERSEDDR